MPPRRNSERLADKAANSKSVYFLWNTVRGASFRFLSLLIELLRAHADEHTYVRPCNTRLFLPLAERQVVTSSVPRLAALREDSHDLQMLAIQPLLQPNSLLLHC